MTDDVSPRLFSRRRQANVEGGRRKPVQIKLTEQEHAELAAEAERSQLSIPRLLVERAKGAGSEAVTERRQLGYQLTELRRLLATNANNANQLAKFANAEGFIEPWAREVVDDYLTLRPLINDVVAELSGR